MLVVFSFTLAVYFHVSPGVRTLSLSLSLSLSARGGEIWARGGGARSCWFSRARCCARGALG
ncbi:MAG: hypothetical protein LBE03_02290, partial [Candidatus Nomurabacteria bacterium]|nr:hypothetical protein [Candidatus Nomurabacteria bacterium]